MDQSSEISENFIDLKALFSAKNPGLARLIPDFVFNFLKRLIHIDVINGYIYKHRDKSGLPFVTAILEEFRVTYKVSPEGYSFPEKGRFIIASNHPLGGLDGLVFLEVMGKFRNDVIFPVNDILMFIPGLKSVFIPINKHGRNTENVKIIHETFASDRTILFFPSGLVSRKNKQGEIRDLDWKKTFISQARKYQRDIIPVFISGKNSNRFYSVANWRKFFGIKANLEMLLLPDEMMRSKGKEIEVVIGEPIPYTTFTSGKTDAGWAAHVKDIVYNLGNRIPS